MNDDTEINIEIQLAYMASWADRSAFYVSKMLVGQIGVNKKYSNLKKCIGINLLDFNYIKETNRFHTTYHISEDTEHIRYTNIMEWHIVELPKLPAMDDGTDLYDWIRLIKADSKEELYRAIPVGTLSWHFSEKTDSQTKRQGKEKGLNTSFSRIQANLLWSR